MTELGTINDPELIARHGVVRLSKLAALLEKCIELDIKIVTAESLTAGLISSALTELSGSSKMLDRAYIVYNNAAKIQMLGVDAGDLRVHEAVSEPVARQMAIGALYQSHADVSVSVTGYASAGGDDTRNIAGGTVFIGSAFRDNRGNLAIFEVTENHFTPERFACREETLSAAIDVLSRTIEHLITNYPSKVASGGVQSQQTEKAHGS